MIQPSLLTYQTTTSSDLVKRRLASPIPRMLLLLLLDSIWPVPHCRSTTEARVSEMNLRLEAHSLRTVAVGTCSVLSSINWWNFASDTSLSMASNLLLYQLLEDHQNFSIATTGDRWGELEGGASAN